MTNTKCNPIRVILYFESQLRVTFFYLWFHYTKLVRLRSTCFYIQWTSYNNLWMF
jgi:hypothetical protein